MLSWQAGKWQPFIFHFKTDAKCAFTQLYQTNLKTNLNENEKHFRIRTILGDSSRFLKTLNLILRFL